MTNTVTLVDAGNDWLATLLEHNCNISVVCGKTCSYVAHKDNNVSVINSNLCLEFHLLENDVISFRLNTSCINNDIATAAPFGFSVDSISCYTGSVLDD